MGVVSLLATAPYDDTKTYGQLGEGRIQVEARGDHHHWGRPGVYWFPRTTSLAEFVERAAAKPQSDAELGVTFIMVRHKAGGGKRFVLWKILHKAEQGSFILEDGDVLEVAAAIT